MKQSHIKELLKLNKKEKNILNLLVNKSLSKKQKLKLLNSFKNLDIDNEDSQLLLLLSIYCYNSNVNLFDKSIQKRLNGLHRFYQVKNATLMPDFLDYLEKLNNKDIEVMLIKGSAMKLYYNVDEPRMMSDIDIFVKKEQYDLACEIAKDNFVIECEAPHSLDMRKGMTKVDLHMDPLKINNDKTSKMWERKIEIKYKNYKIFIPSIEDMLIIQIMHEFLNLFENQDRTRRLKWFYDILILINNVDFKRFCDIVKELDLEYPIKIMLEVIEFDFPGLIPKIVFDKYLHDLKNYEKVQNRINNICIYNDKIRKYNSNNKVIRYTMAFKKYIKVFYVKKYVGTYNKGMISYFCDEYKKWQKRRKKRMIQNFEDARNYLPTYLKKEYYEKIDELKVIGVTGTNGKTTTAYLIWQALNKAKIKCAYIGTIGFYIDNKVRDLPHTTISTLETYELFIKALEAGCKYVVMEVSSQALATNRLKGIKFDYAIFTNLTKDHLDYHVKMTTYFKAKKRLFENLKKTGLAIINNDDNYGKKIKTNNKITIGSSNCTYNIEDYKYCDDKMYFYLNKEEYVMNIKCKYNVYNMVNAIAILKDLKIDNISEIVSTLKLPVGRLETINYGTKRIVIDYAHTPDAVEKVICGYREFCKNKLYVVIGCGGQRDITKRPLMGKIVTDNADFVILTSDNSRKENVSEIIFDMSKDITKDNYISIYNREEAIISAIDLLDENDVLLILGKGHERYQEIGNKKIYFSDKVIVNKYIEKKKK